VGSVPRRSATKNGLGRSNEPPVLILTSLAEGPKHGYALTKDIEQFSGVSLGPGTLYGAIGRLEERGLIEPAPVAGGSDERRRPYRITASGRAALEAAVRDMRTLADEGAARLGLRGGFTPRRSGGPTVLGASS
jgi:DNA-binding PadR family transcriptional regulator